MVLALAVGRQGWLETALRSGKRKIADWYIRMFGVAMNSSHTKTPRDDLFSRHYRIRVYQKTC